ncbi:MAG: prepilin-type N-terminal cleavage/methylation domain-containing protein [Trueperaceae bacterium]
MSRGTSRAGGNGAAVGRAAVGRAALGRAAVGRAGFSLIEALVALLLFAIVAAAALGLQVQALRATRTAEARRAVAAVLRAEVTLQRALGGVPGSCAGAVLGGWSCEVERVCVARGGAPCDLRVVTVRLAAEDGAAGGAGAASPPRVITATTAVYRGSASEPQAHAARRLVP